MDYVPQPVPSLADPQLRLWLDTEHRRIAQALADAASGPAPVSDHGALTGLADNDHPQYLLTVDYTAASVLTKLLTVDGAGSTLDADLLDGRSSESYLYAASGASGANSAPGTWAASDLTQYKAGFWEITGASWTPDTNWWWGLTCAHTSNTSSYCYNAQMIFNIGGTEVYFRAVQAATPQPWRRVYHSGNQTKGTANPTGGADGDTYFQYV